MQLVDQPLYIACSVHVDFLNRLRIDHLAVELNRERELALAAVEMQYDNVNQDL